MSNHVIANTDSYYQAIVEFLFPVPIFSYGYQVLFSNFTIRAYNINHYFYWFGIAVFQPAIEVL
jgi:hypothetical protein